MYMLLSFAQEQIYEEIRSGAFLWQQTCTQMKNFL